MSKPPCGRRPEVGFNTWSKRVERPRDAGIRAYFCTHITKPHAHAARRRSSTHVTERVNCPRAAGIRALFCSHITSFHHISNSGSRHTSVASQRRTTSHSPCRRCMSQGARTSTMNLLLTNVFPISEHTNSSRIIALQHRPFPNQTIAPSQNTYKRKVYCTCVPSVRWYTRRRSG